MIETKQINWFPGHMAKASKNIQESLKNVDLIIEVVDARAVKATSNKEFVLCHKPLLKVALKTDLADVHTIKYEHNLIIGSTKELAFRQVLVAEIEKLLIPVYEKKVAKGIVKPSYFVMIVGLPNVGKSSLINFLAKKNVVEVGNRPAVTKSQSNIKIARNVYLQDNPGVFFKNVRSMEEGCVLALLNTVKREVLPLEEVVKFGYTYLGGHYPHLLCQKYSVKADLSFDEFIKRVAAQRNFVTDGGELDLNRTLNSIYDDFANGNIGRVNYEK